jgi:putative Mg2+ transporter-C (MgtC) family protein
MMQIRQPCLIHKMRILFFRVAIKALGGEDKMAWYLFAIRLIVALVLGALVGAERQWRQRTAGLRTNCLVAVGSAVFVMMGGLISGDGSQGRVAAYVVSGIGFLGGGVILKDGFSIRGLNTAATLWCTAAIGTLAGLGYTILSFLGTGAILTANLLLRPLAQRINRTPVQAPEEVVLYVFECVCRTSDEAQIRALLLQNIGRTPLILYALHSEDQEGASRVKVRAQVRSTGRKDEFLEQIVTRLSLEPGVTTIRWEIASALDVGENGSAPNSFDDSQA